MTLHEAINLCSQAAKEKITLLERVLPQVTNDEDQERYERTIEGLRAALFLVDGVYPPPLGIHVIEHINIIDRVG